MRILSADSALHIDKDINATNQLPFGRMMPPDIKQMITEWERFFKDNGYQREIEEKANYYPEERCINVDYENIYDKNSELAGNLLDYPNNMIYSAEIAIKNLVPPDLNVDLHFRVKNLPIETARIDIRDLRSKNLAKLISLEGLARKVTEVRPRLKDAVFKCKRCGALMKIPQETIFFKEPLECSKEESGCGRTSASTEFKLLTEQSKFVDTQKIEIQESPEGLRGGAQPQRLVAYSEEDLTGILAPGDRVVLNGVLRSRQRGKYPVKSTIFDIFLDINSIELEEHEFEEVIITEEEEEEILKLSKDKGVYQKIISSIAPTIYGLDMEKEALVLQLFGGVSKKMPDETSIRGDIHIILVGDPGTAKSQLLRYISHMAPRGIYTSGKSASAAGLTAAAVRDEFGEGRWTLEAGALVLADKGIACIDELDKMSSQDRSSMHEAMEQQCISIAKAGITATLQSRCALLGAANPKYGRFDEYSPIPEQINITPALLSRFDVIFSITDKPDEKKDMELADHILSVHRAGEIKRSIESNEESKYSREEAEIALRNILPPIDAEFLRKFIAYAKRNIFPVMTNEAIDTLKNYYVNLRRQGNEEGEAVPITPRQLEAFVRLSEASAKVRLSQEVTEEDTERAIKIVEYYLRKVARDESGLFDIDRVATGTPHEARDRISIIREIILEFDTGSEEGVDKNEIIDEAMRKGIPGVKAEEALLKMKNAGEIFEPRHGKYRRPR